MLSWRRPVPAAHGTDAEGACSVSSNLLHSTIIATASPSRRKVRLVYSSAYPRHPMTSLVLHLLMFRARNLRYARECLLCALHNRTRGSTRLQLETMHPSVHVFAMPSFNAKVATASRSLRAWARLWRVMALTSTLTFTLVSHY